MTGAKPSEKENPKGSQPSRPVSKPKTTLGEGEKERREAEDERETEEQEAEDMRESASEQAPPWATRLVPGCIVRSVDMAENVDAVDHTARVINHMIVTHLKAASVVLRKHGQHAHEVPSRGGQEQQECPGVRHVHPVRG